VPVRTPETGSGRVEPGQPRLTGQPVIEGKGNSAGSVIAIAAYALSIAVYIYVYYVHARKRQLNWYDLNVYNAAGLIARHHPAILYTWQYTTNVKFTYTPFAAVLFAGTSELPLTALHWGMTVLSFAALPLVAWLTFGGLGWRGQARLTATFAVCAVGVWLEPLCRALELGQIELVLMGLIVWDFSVNDKRWWKGAGIGLAAGIKMVPLIFIPYLVLCGKFRQAAVATGTFLITIAIGFGGVPHESFTYWLTGYFLRSGNVGAVGSLENQSLYALIARETGGITSATPVWLAVSVVVGVAGLCAGAMLHRRGYPVEGWVTCALTGLLISPISWDQHWIWMVPVLIIVIDRVVRARDRLQAMVYAGVAVLIGVVFGGWPSAWTGHLAFTVHYGMIGWFVGWHPQDAIYHLQGLQLITWNIFIVAGLVMLAVAIAAAVRAWRSGEPAGGHNGTVKPAGVPST
jgi:alpha-1,2-mannosyltransferase